MRRPSARSIRSSKSIRSIKSGKSGRSGRSSRNITINSQNSSEERPREKGKFDALKSGALHVLRKITNAKQIVSHDPKSFENLGGNVTKQ